MSLPANFFREPFETDAEASLLLPDSNERSKSIEHKDRFNFGEKNQNLKKNEEN